VQFIHRIRTRKPCCWSKTQKRSVGGICLLIRIRWNCWNRTPIRLTGLTCRVIRTPAVELLKQNLIKSDWFIEQRDKRGSGGVVEGNPKINWVVYRVIRTRKPWNCWNRTPTWLTGGIYRAILTRTRWSCWRKIQIKLFSLSSNNTEAVELLKRNPDKIDWYNLSIKPYIWDRLRSVKEPHSGVQGGTGYGRSSPKIIMRLLDMGIDIERHRGLLVKFCNICKNKQSRAWEKSSFTFFIWIIIVIDK
jgi:hypothetical protein